MTTEKRNRFTVISNTDIDTSDSIKHTEQIEESGYQSNPIYQKLMNFRNLQDKQKKRFSVDDLFKLC